MSDQEARARSRTSLAAAVLNSSLYVLRAMGDFLGLWLYHVSRAPMIRGEGQGVSGRSNVYLNDGTDRGESHVGGGRVNVPGNDGTEEGDSAGN